MQLVVQQGQSVADTQIRLYDAERHLLRHHCGEYIPRDGGRRFHRHRKFGAAHFLTTEQVADRLDGLKLVVEVRLEMKFHHQSP